MERAFEIALRLLTSIASGLTLLLVLLSSPPAPAETALPPPNGIPACTSPCSSLYTCSNSFGLTRCMGIHRLYSPSNGSHIYATDPNEIATLTQNGDYSLEGLYYFSTLFSSANPDYQSAPLIGLWRCPGYFSYLTTTPPQYSGCVPYGSVTTSPYSFFNAPLYALFGSAGYLYTVATDEFILATQTGSYANYGIVGYVNVPNGLPPPPAPPSIAHAGQIIYWDAVSSATVYELYRGSDGLWGPVQSTQITAPVPLCEHDSFYVTACNAGGCSGPSNTISVLHKPTTGEVCP